MNHLLDLCVFLPFILAIMGCAIPEKKDKLKSGFVILSCFVIFGFSLYNAVSGFETASRLLSFNFSSSGFQAIYGLITSFMWFCAALLSPQYFKGHHNLSRYYFFFLVTLGATMGVFYSVDLITTFVFFEIMSFTSYTWVVQDKNREALSAGKTYLTIAIVGGMACLMGLFLLYNITGTLVISELSTVIHSVPKDIKLYVSAFCMLVGFGAKAGLFPLHIWLPKAHPVAPAPASALLSGVLTKTGVFGILVITSRILTDDVIWGNTLLILGTITMVLGAVLAVFSTNLKRTLACSSLSQIGFITVGVSMISLLGEENALAANGTVLYMFNHSIVKLVLFLSAGAIYLGSHTLDINKLKGYGRNKPVIMIPFLIGGCSLAGIPGTSGYLSKTLVHESIVEYAHHHGNSIYIIEWLFLFSGGLTLAYVLKLFVTIFVEKPTDETPKGKKLSVLSKLALVLSVIIIPVIGVLPHKLGERISLSMIEFIGGHDFHHTVHYFAFVNLKGVLISVAIGLTVYFAFIRTVLLKNKNGKKMHVNPLAGKFSLEENIYKPLFRLAISIFGVICSVLDKSMDIVIKVGLFILSLISRIFSDITDLIILVLSKTILKDSIEKQNEQPHRFSYALGDFIEKHSKHPHRKDNESLAEYFASVSETISQTNSYLSRSFSFALLMTCFGICVVLLFLIFSR